MFLSGGGGRKGALGTNGLNEKTRVSIKQNPATVTKSDKSCNIQITFFENNSDNNNNNNNNNNNEMNRNKIK